MQRQEEDFEGPRYHFSLATTNTWQAPAPLSGREQKSLWPNPRRGEPWIRSQEGKVLGQPLTLMPSEQFSSLLTLIPKQSTTRSCLDCFSGLFQHSHAMILRIYKGFSSPFLKNTDHSLSMSLSTTSMVSLEMLTTTSMEMLGNQCFSTC